MGYAAKGEQGGIRVRERILLMGPPGSGKSYQLIKIYQALLEQKVTMAILDMEDKVSATLFSMDIPLSPYFKVCLRWEEFVEAVNSLTVKPGDWIGVDRIDLTWPQVQRWYTQQQYQKDLSERLLEVSKGMKRIGEFVPRFPEGSWQVINENYESTILKLLYASQANIVMTCGIRGAEDSQTDTFGHLGIAPRGQKELGHQPHTALLFTQKLVGRQVSWEITTAKDLPNRESFYHDPLFDLYDQYVSKYWHR